MQGTIQNAARQDSHGDIMGDDGVIYTYTALGWRDDSRPAESGMRVDFDVRGSHAVAIYPISGVVPPTPPTGAVHSGQAPPVAGGAPPAPPFPQMQGVPPAQPQPAAVPTAPGAATTPQSSPTRKLLGMKRRYWAVAAGGTLILIVAVVAAFLLGLISFTSAPIGNEFARQQHQGREYVLVLYEDELAIFSDTGPVSDPHLAEAVLRSYAWEPLLGEIDVGTLKGSADDVRELEGSVSEVTSYLDDAAGILEELNYMEATNSNGDNVPVMPVVDEAFADRARNTSSVGEAGSRIRSLASDLKRFGTSSASLQDAAIFLSGVDLSLLSSSEIEPLVSDAASASIQLADVIGSIRGEISRASDGAEDLERAFLKASAMSPIRDRDSTRDTFRDFSSTMSDLESELSEISNLFGGIDSDLATIGKKLQNNLDSVNQAIDPQLERWLAEPYDSEWPPADPGRRTDK